MVSSHPTILIGLGRYGLVVMRQLLQQAHDQGALVWEEPSEEEGPGARTLKNLAFLWVADGQTAADAEADLARDLYGQIQEIAPDYQSQASQRSLRGQLAKAAVEAKNRLLDVSSRLAVPGRLRLGLDVIVLAQPVGPESAGKLEDLLEPTMDALADDKSLERPAPGSSLLNFVLFLDFDTFWEGTEANRRLRDEVRASVERWRGRQASGKAGFARIYFTDGQVKEQGRRPLRLRVEEVTILLGLMLFEGQREHAGLRALFEREKDEVSPVSTFGVRIIERPQELMALLSAARFASGWLAYLNGNVAAGGGQQSVMGSRLEVFRPRSLELSAERRDLDTLVDAGLREIEQRAHALALAIGEGSDWPERVRPAAASWINEIRDRLASWAGECAGRALASRLQNLPQRLEEIVSEAIDGADRPIPLGAVIDELGALQRELEEAGAAQHGAESPEAAESLVGVHAEFRDFLRSQLNPAGLRRWWPLAASAASAAWTPILLDAVDSISPPDPSDPFLVRKAYELLAYLAQPWLVGAGLTVLGWVVGARWFEPQIRRWLERGKLAWMHPDQGKLAERLRRAVRSGPISASLSGYAQYLFETVKQRMRAEVRREAGRILDRLHSRRTEIQWLQSEMREYLRTHGVDPDAPVSRLDASGAAREGFRTVIESTADFQRILALNPSTPERFQSAQAEKHPLRQWCDQYCDAFLYPIFFLERLSRDYFEPLPTTSANGGGEEEKLHQMQTIVGFLESTSQFALAFDWSTAGGAVADLQSWCVLPPQWRRLPNIPEALRNHAYTEQRVVDGNVSDRGYLMKAQWGVSPGRLTREVPEPAVELPRTVER